MVLTPSFQQLLKGLEEEVYTGTTEGEIVGLSDRIAAEFEGFSTEPDRRNVEFTTEPHRDYEELLSELMTKRCRLRRFLREIGGYTLVPGGTLSLGGTEGFELSDPTNPYYRYICDSYGTDVVTASSHLNLGVEDDEELIRVYRVLRCEAAMFLAWTASSPFLNGEVTGFHSTRWHIFPKTPAAVPFFADRASFVAWVGARLADGSMQNPRHLWLSVRPNGPASPHDLSRLELRICDRISCPRGLKAMTALFEARVWSVLEDESLDPLRVGDETRWQQVAAENEEAVARESFDAKVVDWSSGRSLRAAEWIERTLESLASVAVEHGLSGHLDSIAERLSGGNPAQRWLAQVRKGRTPRAVLAQATSEMAEQDVEVMGAECA